MAEDMIERVAQAIDPFAFESWQRAYDYEIGQSGDAAEAKAFADWSGGKRLDEARQAARAAVEAIRNPTDHMVSAGMAERNINGSGPRGLPLCYKAMIDAALSPSPEVRTMSELVERLRHRIGHDTEVSPYKLMDEAATQLEAKDTLIAELVETLGKACDTIERLGFESAAENYRSALPKAPQD